MFRKVAFIAAAFITASACQQKSTSDAGDVYVEAPKQGLWSNSARQDCVGAIVQGQSTGSRPQSMIMKCN